jgi:hypothetical protein
MTTPILTKQSAKGTVEFFLAGEGQVRVTLNGKYVTTGAPQASWPRIKAQYPQFNWWLDKVALTDAEYATIKEALDNAKTPEEKAREELAALQAERESLVNAYQGLQEQGQYEFERLWDREEETAAMKVKAEYEAKANAACKKLAEFDRTHPEAVPAKPVVNMWM